MDRGNGPSEINRASRNERHSGQCRIRVVRRVLLVLLLYFSLALFVYLRLMRDGRNVLKRIVSPLPILG